MAAHQETEDKRPLPQEMAIRLFYAPAGMLRLQAGEERCFLTVKVYRAAPLSQPNGPVAFLDGRGNEIRTLDNLDSLDEESRRIAKAELTLRYLTARIERILSLSQEAGVGYWLVETDRGRRDFVVQGMQENCIRLGDDHLLLIDVDGSRFEIPSAAALDARSQLLLSEVM